MPTFQYKARTLQGEPVAGSLWAPSELEALREIERLGLFPVAVRAGGSPPRPASAARGGARRTTARDRIVFTRQLLTIYRSGIPLIGGLEMVREQTQNPNLQETLRALRADVESGTSLADAMARHPHFFTEMYVSVVRAAEASGALDRLLGKLADTLESEARLHADIRLALRYPAMVLCSLVVAFAVVVTFVFPRLEPLFKRFGGDLPLPTRVLLGVNDVVQSHGPLVLVGLAAAALGSLLWLRTAAGKALLDRLLLRLPLVGPVYRKMLMARFAFTVATVQRSGIPLLENLRITARTIGNGVLGSEILRARDAIAAGATLSSALRESSAFLPLVVHLATVGETSGQLDDLMDFVGQHFDEEVRYDVRGLTQMIEPILTVVLAAFVLGLALAIFLPYWSMLKAFRR